MRAARRLEKLSYYLYFIEQPMRRPSSACRHLLPVNQAV